jgi:hypothetical protein
MCKQSIQYFSFANMIRSKKGGKKGRMHCPSGQGQWMLIGFDLLSCRFSSQFSSGFSSLASLRLALHYYVTSKKRPVVTIPHLAPTQFSSGEFLLACDWLRFACERH